MTSGKQEVGAGLGGVTVGETSMQQQEQETKTGERSALQEQENNSKHKSAADAIAAKGGQDVTGARNSSENKPAGTGLSLETSSGDAGPTSGLGPAGDGSAAPSGSAATAQMKVDGGGSGANANPGASGGGGVVEAAGGAAAASAQKPSVVLKKALFQMEKRLVEDALEVGRLYTRVTSSGRDDQYDCFQLFRMHQHKPEYSLGGLFLKIFASARVAHSGAVAVCTTTH